jgi:hypothetical protein
MRMRMKMTGGTLRLVGRSAACGLALLGVMVTAGASATVSSATRVRFHWDWAIERPQAAAMNALRAADGYQRVPLVHDFSHHHVIFPESVPAKVYAAVLKDPRFLQQYLRRHAHLHVRFDRDHAPDPWAAQKVGRDWSFSLNGGSGGTIGTPAKYVFDVNALPSCVTDFVVTGVNIAGSATQANLIGLNSLYNTSAGTGLCGGTAPKVMFAYDIGPGSINSYVALSLDGTKIVFNENNGASSFFHVLTWAKATGNGTSASAAVKPGAGNTAVDTKIALAGGVSTAPFIDYGADVAYVTTSDSVVHKYKGVLLGTPAEVIAGGTGWPVTVTGGGGISTPVFDSVSRHLFFTNSGDGGIDYVDDSVVPAVLHSGLFQFAPGLGTAAPVMVDSGNQLVYAFSSNASGVGAIVGQADTSLSAASQVTVQVGGATGNLTPLMGDFNDDYYNGLVASARLYVIGNDNSANRVPALYALGFGALFKLKVTPINGPVLVASNATGLNASPVTAFFNTSLNKQFIFFGVSNKCSASVTTGCIRSVDVTGGAFPTAATVNNVIFAAAGGTGGISIDNVSLSAGASSVYYTTLTGNTLVKATQLALQ